MSQKSGKLSEVMADTQFAIFPKLLAYHYGFQSDGFHIYWHVTDPKRVRARLQTQSLKCFPNINQIINIQTYFYCFKPVRKMETKYGKLNTTEGHLVAKKRFLLHILLNMRGHNCTNSVARSQKCYIHVAVLPRCNPEKV